MKHARTTPVWLLAAFLVACGTQVQRPPVNSVSDAIVAASADIESAAQTVLDLCGNTTPGGFCAPGSLISTSRKEQLSEQLQDLLETVKSANRLLIAGQSVEADNRLDQVEATLLVIRSELDRLR